MPSMSSDNHAGHSRARLACAILCGFLLTVTAWAADPSSAIQRGKQASALVVLGNDEGHGTAFCISSNGYFVTSAHVVGDRSTDSTVKLVLNPGETDQQEITATILKKGQNGNTGERDFALLRADSFKPQACLSLGTEDGLSETATLTAFGFPFAEALAIKGNKFPNISVSTGKITSLRKDKGKTVLIQLDASINPGNSGGPVIDQGGSVVGVVWAGVRGAGLNFAVPVQALKDFLDEPIVTATYPKVTAKIRNLPAQITAKVVNVMKPGAQFTVDVTVNDGRDDARTVRAINSGTEYNAVFVPVPAKVVTQNAPVEVSLQFEKGNFSGLIPDLSLKVGTKAVKLSNLNSITVGSQKLVVMKDGTESAEQVAGLVPVDLDIGGASVKVDLSKARKISVVHKQDNSDLAHSIPCRIVVKSGSKIVKEVPGSVEVPAVEKAAATAIATSADRPATGSSGKACDLGGVPTLDSDVVTKKLAGTVDDVVMGGGGRYLFVVMKQLKKIGVFDSSKADIVRYLSLPGDDCLVAACADKLIVVLSQQNIVQRYDLNSFEKEVTSKLAVTVPIKVVTMGWNSQGPMYVNWALDTGQLGTCKAGFFDPYSLRQINTSEMRPRNGSVFRDLIHVRASGDGSVFGVWCTSHSPSGLETLVLRGTEVVCSYQHDSPRYIAPNADGRQLMTGMGLFTPEVKALGARDSQGSLCLLPSTHPMWYMGVQGLGRNSDKQEPALSIYLNGRSDPLIQSLPLPEMKIDSRGTDWAKNDFTLDKRFHYLFHAKLLVTIPESNDRIVIRSLDIMKNLEASGIDYLFVTSTPPATARRGKTYSYKLVVQSKRGGLKFSVDGPQGMQVSSGGNISWSVPANMTDKDASTIVTIKDAAGQETFQTFNIAIQ